MKTFHRALLATGIAWCAAVARQEGVPDHAVATNGMTVAALVSNVTKTTSEAHQSPTRAGETRADRISTRLRKEILGQKVTEVSQTNIVVGVNCGDPIYHIAIDIGGGSVTNVNVRVTPICL